jgi:transposase
MASMSSIGVEHFKVLESNGNTANFLAFLRELFQRLANSRRENCILVMDNVRFHRVKEVRDAIQDAGHEVVFLPPYTPFFNPIENMFHQWKSIIRNRAPNTDGELMACIRHHICR